MKKLAFILMCFFALFSHAQKIDNSQLMLQLLEKRQNQYDGMLAKARLISKLQIHHLDGEDDVYNVKELQRYYGEKANQIAEAIKKDPMKSMNYASLMDKLIDEIEKDFNDGNIHKIESSFFAREKFFEDFKSLRNNNPEKFLDLLNNADKKYKENSGNSIN